MKVPQQSAPDANPRPPSRVRVPQAERTAAMREKLIAAAIVCLHARGFTATTLANVADTAGVSRGAITHHFPSKAELVLAVVSAVHSEDMQWYHQHAAGLQPAQILVQLPRMMWQVLSRPAGVAVMEILLGARSDPDLAARLSEIQHQVRLESTAALRGANLSQRADSEVLQTLITGAVRGLAMEVLITRQFDIAEQAIERLTDVMKFFHPEATDARAPVPAPPKARKKRAT